MLMRWQSCRFLRALGTVALLVAGVSACAVESAPQAATTTRMIPSSGTLDAPTGGGGIAGQQYASELARFYRLGVGDKLKITVFGETDLSGQFEVGPLGNIAMPLLGEVPAKGRAMPDFRNDLRRRLADGYLKDPKVSVEVLNYRAIYVHGEVRSAGEFGYKSGITIRDAIAMAGGYTYRANHGYVYLIREGDNREQTINLPSSLPVLPGDNLRIPERFF